ncbi:redoxin domain-containing protein [Megasphaera paucivorans]|uniref:Peroxiredoxin n=1 Tax=Megasphaera paucivorans TaxID=349095 RepID=A0A1H0BDG5_9FIRM|nr:redoxin domain-containing protein [Megasphaera paucivorans]SDN43722.1 Peroxiredoxin [Megasphaera paucivorans]
MSKVKVGTLFPDFEFTNVFAKNGTFYKRAKSKNTVLMFLRFIGCRFTQYDIIQMQKMYEQFNTKNAQIFIVVQSSPETVQQYHFVNNEAVTIICDPSEELYKKNSVLPMRTDEEVETAGYFTKLEQVEKMNLSKGEKEGNPLQKPAVFIIRDDNIVVYAYYGKDIADTPSPNKLIAEL